MASQSNLTVSFVPQVDPLAIPSNPAWQELPVISESLQGTNKYEPSEELQKDGAEGDSNLVGATVAGSYSADFRPLGSGPNDFLLEASLYTASDGWKGLHSSVPRFSLQGASYTASTKKINFSGAAQKPNNIIDGAKIKIEGSVSCDGIFSLTHDTGDVYVLGPAVDAPALNETFGAAVYGQGEHIRNAAVPWPCAVEKKYADVDAPDGLYYRVIGLLPEKTSIGLEVESTVSLDIDFLGRSFSMSNDPLAGATYLAKPAYPVITTGPNIAKIYVDGIDQKTTCTVQSITIDIERELEEQKGIGYQGACDITVAKLLVSGSIEYGFTDSTILQKIQSNTPISIVLYMYSNNGMAYAITMPRCFIVENNIPSGENTIMQSVSYKAVFDPTLEYVIQIDRFVNLPA